MSIFEQKRIKCKLVPYMIISLARLRENASLNIQFYPVDLFFLSIYISIYRNLVHNFRAIIISFLLLMSANLTKVLCPRDNLTEFN